MTSKEPSALLAMGILLTECWFFKLWNIMFEKYNILLIKEFVGVFEAKTR